MSKQPNRIIQYLYKDRAECEKVLTPAEMVIKQRYELCITRMMDHPLESDKMVIDFLMHGCNGLTSPVGKSQAYRDLAVITRLVGNIQLAAKSWYRHMIVEGSKRIYEKALASNDFKGAAAALDKLGKYTRCDKDDDVMDWSEMLPPVFEPSDDITLLEGLTPIAPDKLEAERSRLRNLFMHTLAADAEDAVYEEG